jgi:hypothetical protein
MRGITIVFACLLLATSMAIAQDRVASVSADRAPGPLLAEPRFISGPIAWATSHFGIGEARGGPTSGFRITSGKTIAGSGWLSAGAAYRQNLFDGRAFVEGSVGASLRAYRTAQATFEWRRVFGRDIAVGSDVVWNDFTQVSFFGTGAESLDSMRSQYRIHYADVIAYATARANDVLSFEIWGGSLANIKEATATGPFRRDLPYTAALFPNEPVLALSGIPRFSHGGFAFTVDTRDHQGYPRHGGVYRAGWHAYWASANQPFDFSRVEAEGLQLVSLVEERWTLALRGWGVFTGSVDNQLVPFFMMPTLGGNTSLRAEHAYRFADRHMLLTTVESRLHLTEHLDGALFVDAGGVAGTVGDLALSKRNVGGGVRLHTRTKTLARVDVSRGDAGWRFAFNLNDPFRLSRLNRRTATLPFNP